jgi:hypothetical protein
MPRTVDDVEQDEAPRDDKTRGSLNTTNQKNTKKENTDTETKDDFVNTRTDDDGGHKRNTTSGGAVVTSGNKKVQKDEEKTNDDNAISSFIQNLLSGTFGNTSGDDEDEDTGGGDTGGGTNTGGGGGGTNEQDQPKDDDSIDNPPNTDEQNTGSDRSGQFGSGTGDSGPSFFGEGRNRSKGKYIEYKGVQYPIDRKGTESSETETDVAKIEAAWSDDTFTVGSTTFNLKDYFSKSEEERKALFDTALGLQNNTPPTKKQLNVLGIFWIVKRDSTYGAVVSIADPDDTKKSIFFDDKGNITVKGVTYTAKEIITGDGIDAAAWVYKQVIATQSSELAALYAGWGFTEDSNNTDTPEDENPVTNPQDAEQKFEAKPKSNTSPEGAPPNVENSKALTEVKMRELLSTIDAPDSSIRIQSHIKSVWAAGEAPVQGGVYIGPTSKGYWGFRTNSKGTANQGIPANEYKRVESSITGAVKFSGRKLPGRYSWGGYVSSPILGAKIDPEKDHKITEYPIIMNFPEVGICNSAIPYVAENQTEQHRVVTGAITNENGWGIGAMEGYASWGERSHWCGYSSWFVWTHSGYTPKHTLSNPAGAHNASLVYSEFIPNPITQDSEGTYASLPMFVNPETGKMEVNPELQKMGSPIKGSEDAREHCHLYKFYKQTKYTKTTIEKVPGTKKVNGKLVAIETEKKKEEEIAIQVYEQMLPNPISAYFIRGVHFTDDGMTEMGKKLMDHFLSVKDWEASIITRGSHVEVCPYVNPDGTMWRIGGNTGSAVIAKNAAGGKVSGAGYRFCCQKGKIWDFAADAPGSHVAFHKLINSQNSPAPQKIDSTMNGIFRRTELVDNYMKAVVNKKKNILGTLKKNLYDQIIEPG